MNTDQKNVLQKHPIVSGLIIISIISLFISIINIEEPTNKNYSLPEIPESQILALKTELSSLAEGRWEDVIVGQNGPNLIVKIYAMPNANEVAINGYCKLIKDSVSSYNFFGYEMNLFVYKSGEVVKACI